MEDVGSMGRVLLLLVATETVGGEQSSSQLTQHGSELKMRRQVGSTIK